MPDQLFTRYIENPLVRIPINSHSWGEWWVIIISLEKETWVIGKGGNKRGE
jgi:hypothetical protein